MRYSIISSGYSVGEAIMKAIVILVGTTKTPKRAAFPVVLAVVLPPQFLLLKILIPLRFAHGLQRSIKVYLPISSQGAILFGRLIFMRLHAFMAVVCMM